jgi:hypothetical protein
MAPPLSNTSRKIVSRIYSNKLGELRITQAYIKLLGLPRNEQGTRMVSLERIGGHEIRMFDVSTDSTADAPLFWLELFDHEAKISVDSCNCTEIAQAVTAFDDFVSLAKKPG